MAKTESVATQYGETTIEVVDCDSCGTTIAKDDASEFTLGDRDGWACDHCVDNGPISFPERARKWAFPKDDDGDSLLIWFVAGFLLIPVYCLSGLSPDNTKFADGVFYATATISFYLLVLSAIIFFAVVEFSTRLI